MSKKMAVQNQLDSFVSSQAPLGPCLFRPILLACSFANSCARRNKALNVLQSSVSYPVSYRAGAKKDLVVHHQQSFVKSMTTTAPRHSSWKAGLRSWGQSTAAEADGNYRSVRVREALQRPLPLMDEDAGSGHLLALLFSSALAKAINCRIATPSTAPPRCREYRGAKGWAGGGQ